MYGTDFCVLILLCCSIFQDCDDLIVDNGDVCYTYIYSSWKAHVTCNEMFYLHGSSTRWCTRIWFLPFDWYWNGFSQCEPDTTLTTINKPSVSTTSPFETSTTNKTPRTTTTSSTTTTTTTTTTAKTPTTTTRTSITSISSSAAPTAQEIIDAETTTSSEHGRDSHLAVYIAVPLIVLVLVVVGLLLWSLYRKRRETSSNGSKGNLTEANKTYGATVDSGVGMPSASVENSNSEYAEIPECVNQTTNGNDNNYNTIQMNKHADNPNYNHVHGQSDTYDHTTIGLNAEGESQTYSHLNASTHQKPYPIQNKMDIGVDSQNYNHIPVLSDTYDHTANVGRNAIGESETYSHLNGNQHNDHIPDNYKTGNIYSGPHVGDDRFKSSSLDPYYDHTDIRSDVHAGIELDNYAHVNDGLDEDNVEYTND